MTQDDQSFLEAVQTHRERLGAAFVFGRLSARRKTASLLRRLVVSIVIAAVACAACVGVSFVSHLMSQPRGALTSISPTP